LIVAYRRRRKELQEASGALLDQVFNNN